VEPQQVVLASAEAGVATVAARRPSAPHIIEERRGVARRKPGTQSENLASSTAGVVRRVFQERFTADVMARNYLRLCGGFAELLHR
jgi:hypothetical protein